MLSFIADKLGISSVASAGLIGLLGIVINLIMSKFKVHQKFKKWNDQLELNFKGWLKKVTAGSDKIFFNIGVWGTGLADVHQIANIIYEKAIEPLVIIICETLKNIIVFTAKTVIEIVSSGFDSLLKGLRSDNKEYKKSGKD